MADRVGQEFGNYQLIRRIRQGGFAEVYLGKHLYLETEVAIKVLSMQLETAERQSFLIEARTLAHLVHPHIIRLLDFGIQNSTPYLIMDYAPNGNLRQRHPRGTSLPLATILSYAQQIASALQYVHQHHLIHCDVKPENMLLGRHKEVLLSDFGIALAAQTSCEQSRENRGGTIAYMAPEQIQGEPGPASDQYSLGILVYEWLCGERPFRGSWAEIVDQQLSAPPPSLLEKIPALSPEIEEVLQIALRKNPHQRFASVNAFAHALEEACRVEAHLLLGPNADLPSSPQEYLPEFPIAQGNSVDDIPRMSTIPASSSHPPILTKSFSGSFESPHVFSTPVPPQAQHRLERPLSRRTVVAGLGGAMLVGGSVAALVLQHTLSRGLSTRALSATSPPSTPTPAPGTTLYTYHGHREAVKAVAWSPQDGRRIASGSFDSTVQIWDASTGNHVLKYAHHTDGVKAVAWSPLNGAHLASGSLDKTVRVWDATTGIDILPPYRGHSQAIRTVAWSPDGTRIASGSEDKTVQVWNASTGRNILTYSGHSDKVIAISWSPDARRIASASFDGIVQVWDSSSGENYFTYRGHFPYGVRAVAWSPDGKYLASGGNDRTVQVWDATTGQRVHTYSGHTKEVEILAWSPDGKYLASGSFDFTVKIWNITTRRNSYTYTHHTGQVWAVAWSPTSHHIVSGSIDKTVQVWQAD